MPKWEYLVLDAKLHRNSWRPWIVNGKELPGWKDASFVPYLQSLGEQGWELVALRAHADTETWVFKRPKP